MKYSEDALLIGRSYGSDVMDTFMSTLRFGGLQREPELLERIIAILGVMRVPTKTGM